MNKTRVLVVDDSLMVRKMLTKIINSTSDLEVVGDAEDPLEARKKIKELCPDVLTLDIEMPKMDGITFLKNIMRLRPMPVVMVSTLTEKGSGVTMEALDIGAVDYIPKPRSRDPQGFEGFHREVLAKVRAAALSNVDLLERQSVREKSDVSAENARFNHYTPGNNSIVLIGSSTGGIDAFTQLLERVPANCPPIVIVQHIPPQFSASLAGRLNAKMPFEVKEVADGDVLKNGQVLIAKGGFHLKLRQRNDQVICLLDEGELVSSHRPSVDVMFRSASKLSGVKLSAALLTGMGSDGAQGLGELKQAGCHTIVQDRETSIVWGMPKVAFEQQAHVEMLPLDGIAESLLGSVGCFG